MATEATHTAYTACGVVVTAHMGSEAAHITKPACEADVMAHMGTITEQNGAK